MTEKYPLWQKEVLGTLLHSAWRKGMDTPTAMKIWKLISAMEDVDWAQYVVSVEQYLIEAGWRPPEVEVKP